MPDTIFALSSGALPSGVAIIRLSGPTALEATQSMCGRLPAPRYASLRKLVDPDNAELLDHCLVIMFPGPDSFTGEDVVEFHCHGGRATVEAVLHCLANQQNCRLAEEGEFSRRAFENNKLDLTEIEGLSDLISAQTESQRKLALQQSSGSLRILYDDWRRSLIRNRALIEAEFDFADEDDIPGSVSTQVWKSVRELSNRISKHLDDSRSGEIIRDGFKIALLGPPNSGKSSLINALAKRDVAIVTPVEGTTRDVLEVTIDVDGVPVIVFDTAGIRDTEDIVEIEGIRRSTLASAEADLTLWLQPSDQGINDAPVKDAVLVKSKSDLSDYDKDERSLSFNTVSDDGLDQLHDFIRQTISRMNCKLEAPLITRQRHRLALIDTHTFLEASLNDSLDLELRSENLRLASDQLGRITGRIDVEDLLDVIFSEFCIGK